MTLQNIQEKYLGKRLNLYLIDGDEVALSETGTLTIKFKAEIFDDEALEVTTSTCVATLQLNEERAILGVEPLYCQQTLELSEDDFLDYDCDPTDDHYLALHYALMCAVIRE